ncbi:hypothetical protein AZF05_06830 [Corynebacterium diphtheriae bv. intermedius]|nr:hypothetical protein W5M_03826 [Corynebacterium diphtheriae bv. intermedius str. NCTC 5011]OWM39813.1 hypothetical protein AZF05_06830 [Corynebacterium diphtheriae bv. intermedius]
MIHKLKLTISLSDLNPVFSAKHNGCWDLRQCLLGTWDVLPVLSQYWLLWGEIASSQRYVWDLFLVPVLKACGGLIFRVLMTYGSLVWFRLVG